MKDRRARNASQLSFDYLFSLEKTGKVDSIRQTIIMSTNNKTAVRKTGSSNFEYHGDSKFPPGVYTIQPPSICNHMLDDEAIYLRSNAYEGKVIYIVYFHHMRNADFHISYIIYDILYFCSIIIYIKKKVFYV